MVKNIRPWTLKESGPTYRLCFTAGCYMTFFPHHCCFSCNHTWNSIAGAPAVLPWSLGDTISWPGQTLGELQKPACHPCTCQHATCSGRKPIFYFFLLWQVCLFLASVPTYPASHTETKKSFHFSSHLSRFLKKVLEFSLHSPVGSVVLLCFMYFKLLLFSCVIFFFCFSLLVLLFSFGVFISSVFTTFDYKRMPLKSSKNNYRS